MIKHSITLDYQLSPGWLQPFVEALSNGEALAWRCADCSRTSFPPVRTCTCAQTSGEWVMLAGDAGVVCHTYGQDGSYALVQFAGADTASVVKLFAEAGVQETTSLQAQQGNRITGQLHPCSGELPELILHISPVNHST